MDKERDYKYDILRVFLTVLVVVGHGTYYTIQTPFGGIDYSGLMLLEGIEDTKIHILTSYLTGLIYTFHMPVFFALSGSLFCRQMIQRKWKNIGSLVANKFKRLLIPCFFVWVCWNIPIKYISGYYDGVKPQKWVLQMIFPECVYLWFLEGLFFAFIIVYFIGTLKCKEVWKITLIFLLWVISVLQQSFLGNEWMPLGNPFKYALWFAVGTQYNYITNKIRNLVSKKCNIVLLPIWVFVVLINTLFLKGVCKILVGGLVVPFIAIILLYYWADKISNLNYNKQRLMNASAYSFGIYLWAEPLNYLIIHWVYVNLGVAAFGNEVVALVIWLLRIIGTPLVAILITTFLRRIRFPVKAY